MTRPTARRGCGHGRRRTPRRHAAPIQHDPRPVGRRLSGFEGGVGFPHGRARPVTKTLVAFIGEFKKVFGVEPNCRGLSNSAEWVDRINLQRLHSAIGAIRPVQQGVNCCAQHQPPNRQLDLSCRASTDPGAVHSCRWVAAREVSCHPADHSTNAYQRVW